MVKKYKLKKKFFNKSSQLKKDLTLSEKVAPPQERKGFLKDIGIASIIGATFVAYQFLDKKSVSYEDLRYKEASQTYEKLLRKTAHLSNYLLYKDYKEEEFKKLTLDYHDFLQSDFSLYKGGQVFSPAYELLDLYKGCIMSQDTSPTSNNTNPTDNCAIGKMNGYQYKLSICARQSLDAIKGKPVSISSLPDEALKSLYGIEDKPQRNDCGF